MPASAWPVTKGKEDHVKTIVLTAATMAALAAASPASADDVLNGQLNLQSLQSGTVDLRSAHTSNAAVTAAAAGNAITVTDTASGAGILAHDDVLNVQVDALSKQMATINAQWSDLDQGTSLTAQAVGNQTAINHTTTYPKADPGTQGSLVYVNVDQSNSASQSGSLIGGAGGSAGNGNGDGNGNLGFLNGAGNGNGNIGGNGGDGGNGGVLTQQIAQSNEVNFAGLTDYLKHLGSNDYVTLQANVLSSQGATINANGSWANGIPTNPVSLTAAAFGNSINVTHTTK
jgi:hypothetical protein